MDSYIVDTVAFLAYLADVLPNNANQLFKKAEKKRLKLFLPPIVLGETLYTIYKGKEIFGKSISFEKIDLIFQILQNKRVLLLMNLDLEVWKIFHKLKIPELHDRMIVAAYHFINAKGLITNDPEISAEVNSIWK